MPCYTLFEHQKQCFLCYLTLKTIASTGYKKAREFSILRTKPRITLSGNSKSVRKINQTFEILDPEFPPLDLSNIPTNFRAWNILKNWWREISSQKFRTWNDNSNFPGRQLKLNFKWGGRKSTWTHVLHKYPNTNNQYILIYIHVFVRVCIYIQVQTHTKFNLFKSN